MTPIKPFQKISPPTPPISQVSRQRISFSSVDDNTNGHRVVLYGTGGVGKTTLACLAPGPVVFIDLEESLPILKGQLKEIGATIPQSVKVTNYGEVRTALQSDGWDKIKSIVLDTGTRLEELAVAHTLRTVKKEGGSLASSVEDYGYGKGYEFVFDSFLPILGDLDRHIRSGRNIIITAHDCTTNVPNPDGEDWIRWEPRLQSPNSGKASIRLRLKEWADHVLFMSYDINVKKNGKGEGSGTRTVYTAERPAFMAKSRTTSESFSIEQGVSIWEQILK